MRERKKLLNFVKQLLKKKNKVLDFKTVVSGTGVGRNGFIIEEYKIVKSKNDDIIKYYTYNIKP